MPKEAKQELDASGIDFEQLLADIETMIDSGMEEDIVNVDTGEGEKVRIYVE
jgi:hypothetical protein